MNSALKAIFLVYFSTHIPITLFLDLQGLLGQYYPEVLRSFCKWYSSSFEDHLMGNPPAWFQSFIFAELVFQLPIFFFATKTIWDGAEKHPQMRVPMIIYGTHTATTVLPILADFLSHGKYLLMGIYCPYFIIPLMVVYQYGFNFESKSDRKKVM